MPSRGCAVTIDKPFRYPLAGPIDTTGFAEFLASELGTPGANVRRFTAELCDAFGAERLTLVNSGGSAALVAAFALAEQTGRGQALASGFTSATTLSALQAAGFEVALVDVEEDGFNVDLEALEASIGPSTKVLCVDHFWASRRPSTRSTSWPRAGGCWCCRTARSRWTCAWGRAGAPARHAGDLELRPRRPPLGVRGRRGGLPGRGLAPARRVADLRRPGVHLHTERWTAWRPKAPSTRPGSSARASTCR
jgi:hypothetical protein